MKTITPFENIDRRQFMHLAMLAATGSVLAGCAVNPVTGQNQIMLMSKEQEIAIDKQNTPYQFSSDYGVCQDKKLNAYITEIGQKMGQTTHRPDMPFSFRCVNATYANAYAFPGGSIAATRGIMLDLENEAELSALLGHELGHVNARHTAARMSKSTLLNGVMGGLAAVVGGLAGEGAGQLASGVGSLGTGLLLASYSRDDERQADQLGMEYMVKSGYSPQGMIGLMDMLKNMSQHDPGAIEIMFATHPMSTERYDTALNRAKSQYKSQMQGLPLNKERYMDETAALRQIGPVIRSIQKGSEQMSQKKFAAAQNSLQQALKQAPADYTALVVMAKCQLAQDKNKQALGFARQATQVYPQEAQGQHLVGVCYLGLKNYEKALTSFNSYQKILPGDPNTYFLKGYSLEGMQKKEKAAKEYTAYLRQVTQGEQAQYAYGRLKKWGYVQ